MEKIETENLFFFFSKKRLESEKGLVRSALRVRYEDIDPLVAATTLSLAHAFLDRAGMEETYDCVAMHDVSETDYLNKTCRAVIAIQRIEDLDAIPFHESYNFVRLIRAVRFSQD